MKRTLLAIGVAVLISMLCVPCFFGCDTYCVPFFHVSAHISQKFLLQTIFLAVAAAVIVNVFPRRPKT
jgi:hypothetical protein